jgi:RHS repeat-associated protein
LTPWARADAGAWLNYPFLTSKERDNETGLDFFEARYYGSTQGRFTSPDPLLSSGMVVDPQSWNRYSYVLNNPLVLIDPDGLYVFDSNVSEEQRKKFNAGLAQSKANLEKIATAYGANSQEYKKAERAANAYGAEGVKNGVTIFATTNAKANPGVTQVAGVAGQKTADNPTGEEIRVAFRADTFGDGMNQVISHEGSHVADGTAWVGSGFANSKNPMLYQAEVDALTVQSVQPDFHAAGNEFCLQHLLSRIGRA